MFSKSNTIVRKYIRFYGQVQAVGFRWRAQKAADLYGVTGWVRNEYDDTVSMELQGTEKQIKDVISSLERGTYIRIHNMKSRDIPVVPDETGFRVRY